MKTNRTLSLANQRAKSKRAIAKRKKEREARHPKPRLVKEDTETTQVDRDEPERGIRSCS